MHVLPYSPWFDPHRKTGFASACSAQSDRRNLAIQSRARPSGVPSAALLAGALALFPLQAGAKLSVVVTTPDLASIAHEVGGEQVSVTTLAKPSEDPHFVDAKPSFIVKLNHADALIEGGAELEIGWLPALLEGSRNEKLGLGAAGRIACAHGVALLEVPARLDRSLGDLHAVGNPHYMTDPINAKVVAETICESFSKLDAGHSQVYRNNLATFSKRLDEKAAEWQRLLAPCKGMRIAAYHNTWPYFAARFGLQIDVFLEPKPGIPPTPAHLAEVIAKMNAEHIRAIIVEPFQNRKTAENVAGQSGAQVLDFAQYPGAIKSTETYLQLMDFLVRSLAAVLTQKHE